jgi:hypothetical protein
MENKNLPEFIALIQRYESIQLAEIKAKFDEYAYHLVKKHKILKPLTGFGYSTTCKLCVAVTDNTQWTNCSQCVYMPAVSLGSTHCNVGGNEETYEAIYNATTPTQLLTAYRNRAARMREVLKEKGIDINF